MGIIGPYPHGMVAAHALKSGPDISLNILQHMAQMKQRVQEGLPAQSNPKPASAEVVASRPEVSPADTAAANQSSVAAASQNPSKVSSEDVIAELKKLQDKGIKNRPRLKLINPSLQ